MKHYAQTNYLFMIKDPFILIKHIAINGKLMSRVININTCSRALFMVIDEMIPMFINRFLYEKVLDYHLMKQAKLKGGNE